MKIVTIIGARPQFIKAAAVSRAIAGHNGSCLPGQQIREVIVHTGQHYDANMSQIFFEELQIPTPDYHLGVGSGRHGEQTGAMLARIEEVLLKESPDYLLVYGDTNSTLAGAVAAVKLHITSIHVEAGLRSHNRRMPEEINRIIADQTCNLLLCPTELAVANLKAEGIGSRELSGPPDFNRQSVRMVGDVMYDSVLFNGELAEGKSGVLAALGVEPGGFTLATLHRAENTDDLGRLGEILRAFSEIASPQCPLVLPLHPRTKKCIAESGLGVFAEKLRLVDPVGYLDMLKLEKNARIILTDSGGVQKEAYFMRVPCITLREETEWTETVALGWNRLAGADRAEIVRAFQSAVTPLGKGSASPYAGSGAGPGSALPYGDGHAAEKIVRILADCSHRG